MNRNTLCECGCGEPVTLLWNRFLHGHHRRGVPIEEKTLMKRSLSLKRHYEINESWKKGKILVNGKFVSKSKVILPFCECGCGQRVSRLGRNYVHGHNSVGEFLPKEPWNKGLTKELDIRLKKISDNLKGPPKKSIQCLCGCGMMTKPGSKYISGHNFVGVKQSEETIAKRVEKTLGQKRPNGNWNPWSTGLTKKTDDRIKQCARKTSKAMTRKFQDEEFCRMWGETHSVSPNRLELKMQKWLNNLFPKEYRFVGNFDFFVGGKCPDFVNVNGQKKLIEVWGNYWHDNDDPKKRIKHFAKYGFKTLILREDEIKNHPWITNRKLFDFNLGGK